MFGSAIGLVKEYPFQFRVQDKTPIRQRPIQYNKDERQWINNYLQIQEELGILQRVKPGEPEPTFVVPVVLVKGGQSQ